MSMKWPRLSRKTVGEEKRDFFEGNRAVGIAAADAAKAVQPDAIAPVPSQKSSGVSSDAPGAAPPAHAAEPSDAPSKKSSVPSPDASAAASAVPAAPPSPLEQKVIDEALKKCFDPEIPVNIWELGLIYSISASPSGVVDVKMTLTAPACPVAGSL